MESVFRVSIERVRNTHKNTEKRMDETNVACIQSLCEDDYNLAASILAKQKTSDTTRLDTQTQAGEPRDPASTTMLKKPINITLSSVTYPYHSVFDY